MIYGCLRPYLFGIVTLVHRYELHKESSFLSRELYGANVHPCVLYILCLELPKHVVISIKF